MQLVNRFGRTKPSVISPSRQKPISPISVQSTKHSRNQSGKQSQQINDMEDQPALVHIMNIPKLPNLLNTKAKAITHIQTYQEELNKEQKKLKKQLDKEKSINDQLNLELENLQSEKSSLLKSLDKLNQLGLRKDQELKARNNELRDAKQQLTQANEQLSLVNHELNTLKAVQTRLNEKKSPSVKDSLEQQKTIQINLTTTQEIERAYNQLKEKHSLAMQELFITKIMLEFSNEKEKSTEAQMQHQLIEMEALYKTLKARQSKKKERKSSKTADKENYNPSSSRTASSRTEQIDDQELMILYLKKENQRLSQLCEWQEHQIIEQGEENINLKKSLLSCNIDWFLNEQCQVLGNQVQELRQKDLSTLNAYQYRQLFLNAKHELLCLYRLMRDNRRSGAPGQTMEQTLNGISAIVHKTEATSSMQSG